MQRRSLLKLGVAAGAVMVVAGGGLALMRPGLQDGRLTADGRAVFAAVAAAVLDGLLPSAAGARAAAIQVHLGNLDITIAGFAPAMQAELAQMVALLASSPGRRLFAGLANDWPQASVPAVQAALQDMRLSRLALRQQVYHALRDLTNAAHFADPASWQAIGYEQPLAV